MYYQATIDIISEVDTKQGVKEKRIKKHYLVDAVSVTDVEVKIVETFKNSSINFEIKSVSESKISEVLT